MRIALAASAALVAMAAPLSAQETVPDAPVIAPMMIGFDDQGLSGPGGELLAAEVPDTQFVVIGEDHGYADAPRLVTAFAAEGKEHGLTNYAVEVGPYSSAWVAEILAKGGPDALGEELQGRPLAIPFLNSREEAEAALGFLRFGQLWGSDQEFVGSPLLHFELLGGGRDLELVARLAASEREAFAKGDLGAIFMTSATDSDWEALEANFSGDTRALERLAELRRSAAVYRSNVIGRGLDNNLDRVEMIREYFLDSYRSAEVREGAPPRVIMKFGATHASRATTPMNTFDLGALVEGMAAANGLEALHIAYLPLAGEQLAITPSSDGFYAAKPTDAAKLRSALETAGVDLSVIVPDGGHYLIPLEPVRRVLRNRGLADLDGMTRFLILGFDYIVTTMDGRPATPLAER